MCKLDKLTSLPILLSTLGRLAYPNLFAPGFEDLGSLQDWTEGYCGRYSFFLVCFGRLAVNVTQSSLLYLSKFSRIAAFQVLMMSFSLSDLYIQKRYQVPYPLLAFFSPLIWYRGYFLVFYFRPTSEFI